MTAYSAQQTADGGYIMTGYSGDVVLLKIDNNGSLQWANTLVGRNNHLVRYNENEQPKLS